MAWKNSCASGDLQRRDARRRRPRTDWASSRRRRRSTPRRRRSRTAGLRVRVVGRAVAVEAVVADIGEVDVDAAVRPVVRRVQVGLRRPVAVLDDLLRPHHLELGADGLDVIGQPVGVGVDRVRRVRRRGHVVDAPVGRCSTEPPRPRHTWSRPDPGCRSGAREAGARPPARPGRAGAAGRRGRGARASRHAVRLRRNGPVPGARRRRAGRAHEPARARTAPRSARPRRARASARRAPRARARAHARSRRTPEDARTSVARTAATVRRSARGVGIRSW